MQNSQIKQSPLRRRPLLPLQREIAPGCKQVPLEYTRGIVRWAHPDGYFLNARGQRLKDRFGPSRLRREKDPNCKSGKGYPILGSLSWSPRCHIFMGLAFYGPRPIFKDKNGKEYVGICHHLIPDPLDYKPANLLCWLTRAEHAEADRRQRALKKVLGDMHILSYDDHCRLQDPRYCTRAEFEVELEDLRAYVNEC